MLESRKCYQKKKKKLEQSKGDQEWGGGSDRSQGYIGQISPIEKLGWQQNLKAMRELSKCIFKGELSTGEKEVKSDLKDFALRKCEDGVAATGRKKLQ